MTPAKDAAVEGWFAAGEGFGLKDNPYDGMLGLWWALGLRAYVADPRSPDDKRADAPADVIATVTGKAN